MVQNRVAPHAIKRGVGKRETLAVGLHEIHADAVGPCTRADLVAVAGRKVKGSSLPAATSQDNRGHPVSAAVIQHAQTVQVAQLLQSGPNPGFVIEIEGVRKTKVIGAMTE